MNSRGGGRALAGVAPGLIAMRWLGGFLYGVSPTDPVTFVAAPLVLIATSLRARWIPARRATRVNPMATLREE